MRIRKLKSDSIGQSERRDGHRSGSTAPSAERGPYTYEPCASIHRWISGAGPSMGSDIFGNTPQD